MSESSGSVEPNECETLSGKKNGPRVLLAQEASDAFWSLDRRILARLVNLMDLWVEDPQKLSEKQLRSEGRCGGAANRMLMAFKNQAVRLFGAVYPLGGRTFVVLDVEPKKQSQKARKHILERARKRVREFEGKCGGENE
jgi:hypothetical protein